MSSLGSSPRPVASLSLPSRPSLAQIGAGVLVCEAAGLVGAAFTQSALQHWYPALLKPAWTPPAWVFAPVWTVLYAMMGCALAYFWASPPGAEGRVWSLRWFWMQLGLTVVWSLTFFSLRAPAVAYMVVLTLWMVVLCLLWVGSKTARPAFWLLLPYFLWVTFASTLNFAILSLNVLRPKVEAMDAMRANQRPEYQTRPSGTPIPDRDLD